MASPYPQMLKPKIQMKVHFSFSLRFLSKSSQAQILDVFTLVTDLGCFYIGPFLSISQSKPKLSFLTVFLHQLLALKTKPDPVSTKPFRIPQFLLLEKGFSIPRPSLNFKDLIQALTNQGCERTQKQSKSKPSIIFPMIVSLNQYLDLSLQTVEIMSHGFNQLAPSGLKN